MLKKHQFYLILLIIAVPQILGGCGDDGNNEVTVKDGKQYVSLNISANGYNPNVIVVKEGVPLVVETNSTPDAGCVRGVMIPEFNINKAMDVGPDRFEFTPDKKGKFEFMCQMRMSSGTLVVI